jgi:hypothetical protein
VLIFSLIPFLSDCLMMFLPAMPMTNNTSEMESDPEVSNAIIELIQKGAKELVDMRLNLLIWSGHHSIPSSN